jgi:hypothetical protein
VRVGWKGMESEGQCGLRSYGLSQSAAISLATRDLAAEGQRSSLEISFNGD